MSVKEYIKTDNKESLIIDYGGPNIGKPLHVGHLRPLNIGRSIYNTNKEYRTIGIISGKDITTEAAIAKLMFMLGQNISAKGFKTKFETSLRGEMK